ncbi:MAG: PAS domain-containing protein [Pseudohongiellaceae bacterium]
MNSRVNLPEPGKTDKTDNLDAVSSADLPSGLVFRDYSGTGALTLAFLAMLGVLLTEPLTPLGLAHGLLYAPIIIAYFLLTLQTRNALLLSALGVAFVFFGWVISAPATTSVTQPIIIYNRLLSVLCLLAAGFLCYRIGRLMRRVSADRHALTELNRSLHTKEQLLAIAAEANKFGGFCIRVPEREVLISDQALAIFGLPAGYRANYDKMLGYYLPEYHTRVQNAFRRCLKEQKPYDIQAEIINARGQKLWIRAIASPWLDPDGQVIGIQGSLQDITDQKKMQDTLKSSQDRFRTVANGLPIIMWTANQAGEVNFVNRAAWDYSELEFHPEMMRDKLDVFIHPEDLQILNQGWAEQAASTSSFKLELRLLDRNGEYRWHFLQAKPLRNDRGEIIEWCGVAIDIDDLKSTRRRYLHMAQLLENTFESITDILFCVDSEWQLSYLNTRAAQAFSHSRDALIGRSLWELCPEWTRSEVQDSLLTAAAGEEPHQFDFFSEKLDAWLQCLAYPMEDGLVLYCQDVTSERQLENQLRKAQRMESVGLLTGGIAHDFNNLLTVILGNVESVREDLGDQEKLTRQLAMAERAARNGAELVRQLLAFACRQPLRNEATGVNELLSDMEPLVRHSVSEAIDVQLHLSDRLWPAHVDRFQLESAVMNMCLNSMQAMQRGGRLLIETANDRISEPKTSSVLGVEPGDYVRISISDDGKGIAREHLDKIFDPFFTTKEMGTGLGLSTIYGFIKQSGGDISVYSEPERGTTFNIYLPRATTSPEQRPEITSEEKRGGTESLLVVEDDENVREYACSVLSDAGYRVTCLGSGTDAIELLKTKQDFSLLFTDIVMPGGIHGPELAELALAVNKDINILFTSGYTANAAIFHGQAVNENIFLKKPYQRDQLLSAVRTVIDRQPGNESTTEDQP